MRLTDTFLMLLYMNIVTHQDDSEYVFYVRSIMNVSRCYPGEADQPILLPTPDHHNTCPDIKMNFTFC
jgi:hypothetical protein